METREQRGIIIAATVKLAETHGVWVVPSQSGDKRCMVDPTKGTCTCPDCQGTGFKRKHQWAVEFTIKRERQQDGTIVEQKTFTWTESKTYTQNWPAYNEAQTSERRRFKVLLFELCRGITEPEHPGRGRKPIPLRDQLFCTCYKVYSLLSHRRFTCDLDDAVRDGHIGRPVCWSKVCQFLENENLTPYPKTLIAQSSLPLRTIESEFAVDSTGFSVSKFVRWFDEKCGCERSGKDWVKVHIACGTKTHCVTAAAIYGRDAADCPVLPELLRKTRENFKVNELSADKAYLSVENIEVVFAAGGSPFIAPKSNTTGSAGGLFEKMFHYFRFNSEQFMSHYNRRQNVESVMSAVKRKFGDSVRARCPAAMVNEVLAKLVCQNITAVIASQCELGIEPVFWQNESGLALASKI
jgi:transposase